MESGPGGPGIPVDDDDDFLGGTFVEDGGAQEVEEGVGASVGDFDDMSLDELDDATLGRPAGSGTVEMDVDVDDDAPPSVLALVNSEASSVMEVPPEATRRRSRRSERPVRSSATTCGLRST
jgi:hypothetical protein